MRNEATYRSVRRNEWKVVRKHFRQTAGRAFDFPWANYNTPAPRYQLGTISAPLLPPKPDRSKYMPHIGNKERGRYAA